MTNGIQLFILFLVLGILLLAIEIFVPGGILGVIGGVALLAAIITAFMVFGPQIGFLVAVGIFILLGICIMVWIVWLPKTRVGKALTLTSDGKLFKVQSETSQDLVGKKGISMSELHPGGIARIDGRRLDVVADGCWISRDKPIEVVKVVGNHVVVRESKE